MEVSVTGDQAAMPVVSGTPVLHVSFNSGEDSKSLYFDDHNFSSVNNDVMDLLNDHGIRVTSSGENSFQLKMTSASIQNLELSRGNMGDRVKWKQCIRGKRKGF